MYRYILCSFFMTLALSTFCQTSYAEYICITRSPYTSKVNLSDFVEGTQKNKTSHSTIESTGIVSKTKLCVYANSSYSFVKIMLLEINLPGIKTGKESETHLLLDKKARKVYDYSTNTVHDYHPPFRIDVSAQEILDSIISKKILSPTNRDTATLILKKNLPKHLSANLIVEDLPFGISQIRTKRQTTTLILFKPAQEFSFAKELGHAQKKCSKTGASVNYLFNQ